MEGEVMKLTLEQTDELIRQAALTHNSNNQVDDGAIEDCEIGNDKVTYFFESGARGIVDRTSGQVTRIPSQD
jgi:hypothetical protein